MLIGLIGLKCDFCTEKALVYDEIETFKAFIVPESLMLFNADKKIIDEIVDKSITKYLVFSCKSCKATVKHTFKDIEKKLREDVYEKVIMTIAISGLQELNAINFVDKTRVYCGKCGGFDGKGACPIRIFNECRLKRLPNEL